MTWPAPWIMANASTVTMPNPHAAQNCHLGRSPPRTTASAAVAAGSNPTSTAPCADVVSRKASELHSGNPTTTPKATRASRRHCAHVGRDARATSRHTAPSSAAGTALPMPTVTGPNAGSAASDAGNVRLNASTPRLPHSTPGASTGDAG